MTTMRQIQASAIPVMFDKGDRSNVEWRGIIFYRRTEEQDEAREWSRESVHLLWMAQRLLGDNDCFRSSRDSVNLSRYYWRNRWI